MGDVPALTADLLPAEHLALELGGGKIGVLVVSEGVADLTGVEAGVVLLDLGGGLKEVAQTEVFLVRLVALG